MLCHIPQNLRFLTGGQHQRGGLEYELSIEGWYGCPLKCGHRSRENTDTRDDFEFLFLKTFKESERGAENVRISFLHKNHILTFIQASSNFVYNLVAQL